MKPTCIFIVFGIYIKEDFSNEKTFTNKGFKDVRITYERAEY